MSEVTFQIGQLVVHKSNPSIKWVVTEAISSGVDVERIDEKGERHKYTFKPEALLAA